MFNKLIISLLLIVILPLSIYSQQWKKDREQKEQWSVWAITANAGFTSFYGDLSSYDGNYLEKLRYESGPAMSLIVTKHFDRLFAISGQIISGKIKGASGNASFNSEIIEYNLHLRLNLINLFAPRNNHKFGLVFFGGLGNFIFSTTQTIASEGTVENISNKSRVPELVYFTGGEIVVQLFENFSISSELSIRKCRNDMLDGVAINDNDDNYSYLNFGITYYIGRFKKNPIRNRARIAHSGKRLKPLK